ncbi:MAG TPA: branched-chain amino acid ABC transporter substrate-binding protein [Candidatus Sulfotelmatobacter sp.]|nr:branched-chain amino acid ABC transporter substrate-binding protein [Candidatus Sulfotelmatobacter sp.]
MIRSTFLSGLGGAAGATQIAQVQLYTASVRVAVVCPTSGDAAALGKQLARGAEGAADELNRFRSSFAPAVLIDVFDDHDTAADAIVQAGFATGNPDTIAVIGHLGVSPTYNALRVYATANCPLIVPTVTDDSITEQGYRNVFRLPTKDATEGSYLADYALTQVGYKAPHVVAQDGDYGLAVAAGFIRRASALKMNVVGTKFSFDKPDYADAANTILAHQPDCVVMCGNVEDMGPIMPALIAKGYTGKFMASQGYFDPITTSTYAKEAEGLIVSTSMPYLALAPSTQEDVRNYQQNIGPLTPVAAFGYAGVQLIEAAAQRYSASNRLALLRALQTGGPYATMVGSYTFGPYGDALTPNVYFYRVRDGKFTYDRQARSTGFMLK